MGTGGGAAGLTILAQEDLGSTVREDDLAVGALETGAGGGLGAIAAVPLTGAGCSSSWGLEGGFAGAPQAETRCGSS